MHIILFVSNIGRKRLKSIEIWLWWGMMSQSSRLWGIFSLLFPSVVAKEYYSIVYYKVKL
jgi:hypothetical protein